MKTNFPKSEKQNENLIDDYDYMANAASSGDCTGLIPGNPLPDDLMEPYLDIYLYEPPKAPSPKE